MLIAHAERRELTAVRNYLAALATPGAAREAVFPDIRVRELVDVALAGRAMAQTIDDRQQRLEMLFTLDRALTAANTVADVTRTAAEHACRVLRFDPAAAFVLDTTGQTLTLVNAYRIASILLDELRPASLIEPWRVEPLTPGRRS